MRWRGVAVTVVAIGFATSCGSAPAMPSVPGALPSPSAAATAASPAAVATAVATPRPTEAPSRVPGFHATPKPPDAAAELDGLLDALEDIHPEPFHGIARGEWVAHLEALKARLPELELFEAQVELQRLVALLSRAGRDGHQFALPIAEAPVLPIRVYEFEEGVYVTAAMEPHGKIAGRRLTAIGSHPIEDVLAAIEPLVPRDGPATVAGFRPMFIVRTSVLDGLGLIDDGPVSITVAGEGGQPQTVELEPVPFEDWADWAGRFGRPSLPHRDDTLYLSRPEDSLWWDTIDDSRALYVRYQQVVRISRADAAAIAEAATQTGVERVILDLRQNPGGDNHYFPVLLDALQQPAVDREGRLFVLTDRLTFSAASNFATSVEQSTAARFAGEPMGGGLNFWNDVSWFHMPEYPIPMRVAISTRYWQFAGADDPRLTIEPDVPVSSRAADYFAGRDPVLEAVLGD